MYYSVMKLPTNLSNFLLQENEKNNLFRFGLNFVSIMTNDATCESKALLIEFHSKNKQYLYTILRMITVTLKKEDLQLVTAAVTFYFRISQHLLYCKYLEINDLVESMVSRLCSGDF